MVVAVSYRAIAGLGGVDLALLLSVQTTREWMGNRQARGPVDRGELDCISEVRIHSDNIVSLSLHGILCQSPTHPAEFKVPNYLKK